MDHYLMEPQSIMFEGIPNYPNSSRWWQIVDKYKVNIFYTAPTAIRALMREGDDPVKKTSRKSVKTFGYCRGTYKSRSMDVVLQCSRRKKMSSC